MRARYKTTRRTLRVTTGITTGFSIVASVLVLTWAPDALAHHRSDHSSGKPSPAPSSSATPSPSPTRYCSLVVDPAGDARSSYGLPYSGSLDLLGGDVATNSEWVTVVIRVPEDPRVAPADRPFLRVLTYYLVIPGGYGDWRMGLEAQFNHYMEQYQWFSMEGGQRHPSHPATGSYDPELREIRISVPTAEAGGGVWDETYGLQIESYLTTLQVVGAAVPQTLGFGTKDDIDAAQGSPYAGGAPSCVTPGP